VTTGILSLLLVYYHGM